MDVKTCFTAADSVSSPGKSKGGAETPLWRSARDWLGRVRPTRSSGSKILLRKTQEELEKKENENENMKWELVLKEKQNVSLKSDLSKKCDEIKLLMSELVSKVEEVENLKNEILEMRSIVARSFTDVAGLESSGGETSQLHTEKLGPGASRQDQLLQPSEDRSILKLFGPVSVARYPRTELLGNPVGVLHEICVSAGLPMPSYNEGPVPDGGHGNVCRLLWFEQKGIACSKKNARKQAALNMLKFLTNNEINL